MSRPRLPLDYKRIRELAAAGLGTRRIARKMEVSRSVVARALNGSRPECGPREPCRECERRRTTDATGAPRTKKFAPWEREHAHRLLDISRGTATDKEFLAAKRRLDFLLDTEPNSSVAALELRVQDDLERVVDQREEAARRAVEARDGWERGAVEDLNRRWKTDARPLEDRIDRLDLSPRWRARELIKEERTRTEELLKRRLKERESGAVTEDLVDRLVADGLARAAERMKEAR